MYISFSVDPMTWSTAEGEHDDCTFLPRTLEEIVEGL